MTVKFIIPSKKYNSAEILLEAGKYDEAYVLFEEANGFKDSNEKSKNARYQEAKKLIDEKKYEDAYWILMPAYDLEDARKILSKFKVLPSSEETIWDGKIHEKANKKYDYKGNLIEDSGEIFTDDGSNRYRYNYEYDKDGNCVKKDEWTSYGYNKNLKYTYEYDDTGKILVEQQYEGYYSHGLLNYREDDKTFYEYDEKNRCSKSTCYDLAGKIESWTTYTYDESDRLVEETFSSGLKWLYKYDQYGNCIEKSRVDGDDVNTYTNTYTYDYEKKSIFMVSSTSETNKTRYSDYLIFYNE